MGTNAMIARRVGKGFEARVTYFDGDPQRLGHNLFYLLHERYAGNSAAMVEDLMTSDWTLIEPKTDADYLKKHKFELEASEKAVDGLGVSQRAGGLDLIPWQEGEGLTVGYVGWIYAFEAGGKGMQVYRVKSNQSVGNIPELVATIDLWGVEPNWQDIECGEHLERCGHAAFVHAERLGIDPRHPSAQLSLRQLAGIEEMTNWNAIGVTYKGRTYQFTGNGQRGEDGDWYSEVLIGKARLQLNINQDGVEFIYPKLREELLRSGEMKVWPWVEQTEIEVVL